MKNKESIKDTSIPLLNDAQAFLQTLLDDRVPDTVLAYAWDDFYRLYDSLIRRFMRKQGVPPSDVEDCVQEVWTEVVRRLIHFDRQPNQPGLRSWLYTIVRSKSADLFRRTSRQPTSSLDDDAMSLAHRPSRVNVAEIVESKWKLSLVESAMEQLECDLSDVNHQILRLRLLDGEGVEEVAQKVNLEPPQVRYRYHRALRKLRLRVAVLTGDCGLSFDGVSSSFA